MLIQPIMPRPKTSIALAMRIILGTSSTASATGVAVGAAVEADLGGAFFPAKVTRASGGTYDVEFCETVGRVAGGAIAKKLLATFGVQIIGYTLALGDLRAQVFEEAEIERNIMRCPDSVVAAQMIERVAAARQAKDSLGGIVELRARGVPPGLGEPVFDKLQADLGKAMFSIPAIKGVEIGEGFGVALLHGSENNDSFVRHPDGQIGTVTNRHGGILGGISTGEEIVLRLAAKPTPSIAQPQQTVDHAGNPATIEVHGRHDPTVLPRLVPVAEAMLALVLADHLLRQRAARVTFPQP